MGFRIETIFLIAGPKEDRINKVTRKDIYSPLLLFSEPSPYKDEFQIILSNSKISISISPVFKNLPLG